MSALPALNACPTLASAVWRADQLGHAAVPGVPTQYAALDAQLPGGGWPRGAVTELLGAHELGGGSLRLALPALAHMARTGLDLMWIAPPAWPYAPALLHAGLPLTHVWLVQPRTPAEGAWAAEEALKSAQLGAVLVWLPEATHLTRYESIGRLQRAAATAEHLCFLFRPLSARAHPSPAPLRLAVAPGAQDGLSVTIVKRRGPPLLTPLQVRATYPSRLGTEPNP